MKTQFAILIAALILVGCNAQTSKEGQSAIGQDSLNPKSFPAYQDFGVEGYYGKIHLIGSSKEQLAVQAAALDFWFETSANFINDTRFFQIYAAQGANAYWDSLKVYFAGELVSGGEQYDYYWLGRYTERAKNEILAEKPCEISTPEKCKELPSYRQLSEEDQQICDKWRKAADECRDVWFHCPGATFFEAGKPVVNGKEAKMPLQLYQATYDENHEVSQLNKCRMVNLYFVLIGEQWIFDHREIHS